MKKSQGLNNSSSTYLLRKNHNEWKKLRILVPPGDGDELSIPAEAKGGQRVYHVLKVMPLLLVASERHPCAGCVENFRASGGLKPFGEVGGCSRELFPNDKTNRKRAIPHLKVEYDGLLTSDPSARSEHVVWGLLKPYSSMQCFDTG